MSALPQPDAPVTPAAPKVPTFFRNYKYRLYPTPDQEKTLNTLLWWGYRIWRDSIAMLNEELRVTGRFVSKWTIIRDYWTKEARPQYRDQIGLLPASTVDAIIRRLYKAYNAAFKRKKAGAAKPGFPSHRKKFRDFGGLDYVWGKGVSIDFPTKDSTEARLRISVGKRNNYIYIPMVMHRPVPEKGKIKNVVLMRDGDAWYAVLQIEMTERPKPAPAPEKAVGIDLGMVYLLALSDGTVIDNPRWYRQAQVRRRILQRKLDRQRRANNPNAFNPDGTPKAGFVQWKRSTRMKETEAQLRKLEHAIANKRKYFWHGITDWLTRSYNFIALEDLTLDFMKQNSRLAMSVHDAAFATFWQMLEYKAKERGVRLAYVPPQYTSQRCAACGHVTGENRKTQATFRCVSCGHCENADLNAARNVLQLAVETASTGRAGRK